MNSKIKKVFQNYPVLILVALLSACGGESNSGIAAEGLPNTPSEEETELATDTDEPDVAEPDVAEPDVAEPDVAEPDVAEPDVTEPDVAEPDVAEPDVAEAVVPLLAVQHLKAKPSDQEISLTFSADLDASQYEVFISKQINISTDCADESNECRSVRVAENSVIFNQLDNAQQYSLWVRALDAKGNPGEVSAVITLSPDQFTQASNIYEIGLEQSLKKLSSNGEVLETAATDWRCVFDNDSKLVWEVKHDLADFNVRLPGHVGHKFSWKNTDATKNLGQVGGDAPAVIPGVDGSVFCDDDGSDALLACNTESYVQWFNSTKACGFDDWRLPTVKELQTIISYSSNDLLDTQYFPLANQQQGRVWTGETATNTPVNAIVMDHKEFHGEFSKSNNAIATRLVRGNAEVALPVFRFAFPEGSYSVLDDVITGLQWRICSEGTTKVRTALLSEDRGINTYCIDRRKKDFFGELTDVDGYYTFAEAVTKKSAGWRLPTLVELKTLLAEQENVYGTFYAGPSLFPNAALSSGEEHYQRNHFVPVDDRNEFWSTTEDPSDPSKVFVVNFGTGDIKKRSKDYYARARLVK